MFRTHFNKDGSTVHIFELEDGHLINIIKFQLRKLIEIKKRFDEGGDEYTAALYGYTHITPQLMAEITHHIAELIAPYILEAALRAVLPEQVTDMLQKAFGRKERVVAPSHLLTYKEGDKLWKPNELRALSNIDDSDDWDERDPEEGDR